MPRRGRSLVLALVVLAAAVLPYARTAGYDFVWDDFFVIGPHLDVKGPGDIARIWNTPFDNLLREPTLQSSYFRPATLYTLALDRAMYGENAGGFHVTNVVFYGAACLFLWLFLVELTGMPIAATLGAVIYALHPAHPESVAFISGRTDVQGALFLFAALWAAVRFGPREKRPLLKLLPAALLLLPGLYAKEVALFGAPLLLLVLWVKDRSLGARDLALAALPVVAVCAFYILTRVAVVGLVPPPRVAVVEGTLPQIYTSVAVVARYVPLLLMPIHLTARHEIVEVHTPFDFVFAAGLVVLAALLAGVWILVRRRSIWSVPVALLAATLLPICYVRLLSGAIVAERFLFVPSAGLAAAIAMAPGLVGAAGRRRDAKPAGGTRDAGATLLVVGSIVAIWFAVLLGPRVALWKNEGTLYSSMLRDSPESPHVHAIAGNYYWKTRDFERAAYHYRRAIRLDPTRTREFLLNLSASEEEIGQLDSAFVHIRALNALEPQFGHGWYALGNLYIRADKPDSAIAAYQEALRWTPSLAEAENNMGAVYERQGKMAEAIAAYRRALIAMPGNPEATRNLRRLSAELGLPSGLPDSAAAGPGAGAGAGAGAAAAPSPHAP